MLGGILVIVTLGSTIWFVSQIADILSEMQFSDFTIYFGAAEAARAQAPIYDIEGMHSRTFDPFYKYPPLVAHLLKFLVPFGLRKMALAWFCLSIAFYLGSLLLWLFIARLPFISSETFLLAGMLFSSQPAVDSLSGPQMDCFMLFLLFVCCWGILRKYSIPAGASISILTMIKVFPAILLLPLIQSGWYRAVAVFAITLAVLLLISFSLAGIEQHKEFITGVLPANTAASAYVENQSLFGFLARFFTNGSDWNGGRPVDLPVILWTTRVIAAGMLLVTAYLTRFTRVEFALAALVVWLLIALPVAWIHYQTLMFFPAALYLRHQFQHRLNDTAGWFCFAIAWACIAFGNQSLIGDAPVLLQSYKFYGAFLLWILYARAMWKVRNIQSMVVALQ